MRWSTMIARGLWKRRIRSGLTVVGLGVGVAAVVTMSAVAWGFERSFHRIYEAKGVDLIVVRAGTADRLSSTLDADLAPKLAEVPGVSAVARSLMEAVSFEEAGLVSVLVSGWEAESVLFRGLSMREGRPLSEGGTREAMLGKVLASTLGKHVGDRVSVAGEEFRVRGVYDSPSLFESGGLIIPLAELQTMMGREGQVTGFVVVADRDALPPGPESAALRDLGRRIEAALPGTAAVPTRDYVAGDLMIRLAKSMAWATTLVALVLGSVGMLNTMVMSVFERTSEFGLLRALGWRRWRVLALVMGESLVLGVVGGAVGAVLGIVGLFGLRLFPTARGFVAAEVPPSALAVGLGLGVVLSLLGGLYPALRAARLDPIEAIRHD